LFYVANKNSRSRAAVKLALLVRECGQLILFGLFRNYMLEAIFVCCARMVRMSFAGDFSREYFQRWPSLKKKQNTQILKRGQPIFLLFVCMRPKKIKDYVPLGWLGHSVTLFKVAGGLRQDQAEACFLMRVVSFFLYPIAQHTLRLCVRTKFA
jgi:hypothetical protein